MPCPKCSDSGWVCEAHPDKPFEAVCIADNACTCGGAGMPCECNPMSGDVEVRKRVTGFGQEYTGYEPFWSTGGRDNLA